MSVELPAGSRVEILESSEDQMVIHIPAGGKGTGGLLFFTIVWNGFMCVFTAVFFFAGDGPPAGDFIPFLLFISLFWAVGLGIFTWWLRLRFSRFFLLLEPTRFVLQRSMFGRKSVKETALDRESKAELIEAYSQNEKPVYAVTVKGVDQTIKFGITLSMEEKQWFVRTINARLGQTDTEPEVPDDGLPSMRLDKLEDAEEISPGRKTVDAIEIEESSRDYLRFSVQLFVRSGLFVRIFRGLLFAFAIMQFLFILIIFGGVGLFNNPSPILLGVFAVVMLIDLAFLMIVDRALTRGRTVVEITPDSFICGWSAGPMRQSKQFNLDAINFVGLAEGGLSVSSGTGTSTRQISSRKICVIRVGRKSVPIAVFQTEEVAREVAGIIKHQLLEMDIPLLDQIVDDSEENETSSDL